MRYSATVKELQKVDLSFKVAGTVQELYQVTDPTSAQTRDVQVGDAVPSEAVLARLDDADARRKWNGAREQLAKAESQLVAAAADADLAEKDLKRAETLSAKGAGTQENLDAAERRHITADAAVVSAERDVEAVRIAEQQAKDDLDNCSLNVPSLGLAYVAEKYVERSERVTSAKSAFLLIDVSKVRVALGVPDVLISDLQLGQELPVVAESLGGQKFVGRVSKIAPAADLRTRTFLVEVTIDEPGKLKPGMIVTTSIGENREGLLLPMTAIQRGRTQPGFVVYKITSQGDQTVVRECRVELDGVYDNRIHVKTGPVTDIAAGRCDCCRRGMAAVRRSASPRDPGGGPAMTIAQFFVYRRPIAWTALVATLLWGIYAYLSMPQRHDPDITVGMAVVVTPYPGARAEKVEQELTRKIEKKVSENPSVERVHSISRQGLSVVFVELRDEIRQADQIWEDLQTKLQGMTDLPRVDDIPLVPRLNKDFGDTAAVMLTISSPPVSDFEIERRAASIRAALVEARARRPAEYRDNRVDSRTGLSQHGGSLVRAVDRQQPQGTTAGERSGRGHGDRRAVKHRLPGLPHTRGLHGR